MPKTSINYINTIIYKIVCKDLSITDVYVGSTTNFTNRKRDHKKSCNNPDHKSFKEKKYEIIRNNGGWINWEMIEIEKFPCNDSNEARSRERYWYEMLNANLNSQRPLTTLDERITDVQQKCKIYYEANKEKMIARSREYNTQNKEKIREKRNEIFQCKCGGHYAYNHKARHFKTEMHSKFLDTINII